MSENPYKTELIYRILKFNKEYCDDVDRLKTITWELESEKNFHYKNFPPLNNETLDTYNCRIQPLLPWYHNSKKIIPKTEMEKEWPTLIINYDSPKELYLKLAYDLTDEQLNWRFNEIQKKFQGDEKKFVEEEKEDQDPGEKINLSSQFINKWGVKPYDILTGKLMCALHVGDGYTYNPFYDRNYTINELGLGADLRIIEPVSFRKRYYEMLIQNLQSTDSDLLGFTPWFEQLSKVYQTRLLEKLKNKFEYWEIAEKITRNHHLCIEVNLNQPDEEIKREMDFLLKEIRQRQKLYIKRTNKRSIKKIERWATILELHEQGISWPKISEKLGEKFTDLNVKIKVKKKKLKADRLNVEYNRDILPFINQNQWRILLGTTNWNPPKKEKY